MMSEPNRTTFATDTRAPLTARLNWAARRASASLTTAELVEGHDHSRWQNLAQPDQVIPYEAIKAAGYDFVIIKATEGQYTLDPFFSQNWPAAVAAGLLVGVYHFFRAHRDPIAQANLFLHTAQPLRAAVPYEPIHFVDVESQDGVTKSVRTERLITMLDTLGVADVQTGIYTSPGFWNSHIAYNDFGPFLDYQWQWVAHWTPSSTPLLPQKWTPERTKFWQRGISNQHSWVPPTPPGMTGTVDYNLFLGTMEELEAAFKVPHGLEQRVQSLEERVEWLEQFHAQAE